MARMIFILEKYSNEFVLHGWPEDEHQVCPVLRVLQVWTTLNVRHCVGFEKLALSALNRNRII